ncbi:uncharacterized protein ARMOST_19447 [Armillaria ostoyae]|uniref:Uncharacterized protein n=1 Tax=Armillaria ostoyae TaxID=47428 RepID=A0A284S4M0_ARMOS|nr:uncharacterized protein ARMOST_19447 [Armillaria ostoyae]
MLGAVLRCEYTHTNEDITKKQQQAMNITANEKGFEKSGWELDVTLHYLKEMLPAFLRRRLPSLSQTAVC